MVRLANMHKSSGAGHQLTRRVPRNAENSVSKTFPNIAYRGAGTEKMVQSMINALQAEVGELLSQNLPRHSLMKRLASRCRANKAIEYLNNVMDMQSTDMAEIRNTGQCPGSDYSPSGCRAF